MLKHVRSVLQLAFQFSVLAVFFFVGWWLRPLYPEWVPSLPYSFGFLISIPAALAVLCWLALGLPGLRAAFNDGRRWWIILMAGLVLWAILSPGWSRFVEQSQSGAGQLAFVAAFALAVVCAGPTARSVAAALAMGLVWQSVIIVMQVALQHAVGLSDLGEFAIRPGRIGLSVLFAGPERLMRPYGLTVHPNMIAGYVVVALLAFTGWLPEQSTRWRWAVRAGVFVLGVWALCLTFSRAAYGAFAGGIALIALLWFVFGKAERQLAFRRALVFVPVAALIGGVFALSYGNFLLARAGLGGDAEVTELRSVVDRRIMLEIAWQLFQANPIEGVGIGASDWETAQILPKTPYRELRAEKAHNVALLVLSELGLVGFVLFVSGMIAAAFVILRRLRTRFDPFVAGLSAGAAALLAIGLLDHYPWTILHFSLLLWGCIGIAMRENSTSLKEFERSTHYQMPGSRR